MTKTFVINIKGLKPTTSCVGDQDATTAPATHIWFTEFAEFHLGKTPLSSK